MRSALLVVSGSGGTGKTSILKFLSDHLAKGGHILVVGLPEEYSATEQQVVVSFETFSENSAKYLRREPSVIVFDELRDGQQASAALRLVGAGHFVLAGLHYGGSSPVRERLAQLLDGMSSHVLKNLSVRDEFVSIGASRSGDEVWMTSLPLDRSANALPR